MQQMQDFVNVLMCSRRNLKPKMSEATGCNLTKEAQMDPWKDNGISDLSTDASDYSAGRQFGKALDSDTDGSSDAAAELPWTNAASFGGPPGLDPVAAQTHPWHRLNHNEEQIRMNPNAAPFYSAPDALAPPQVPEESNLNSLKEAVDRLTPAEIAAVRSLLDDKLKPIEQSFFKPRLTPLPPNPKGGHGAPYDRSIYPLTTTSAPNRLPFTPWGGPAPRQVKRFGERPPNLNHAGVKGTGMEGGPDSLANALKDLMEVEDGRVVSVRKIGKLGFESGQKLEVYFKRFGAVEKTLVPHTKAKKGGDRVRPAALGFVVMEKVESVNAILAHGEFHVVDGFEIQVTTFQSHSVNEKIAVAESL